MPPLQKTLLILCTLAIVPFFIYYSNNKAPTIEPNLDGEKTGTEPLIESTQQPDPSFAKSQVYSACQPLIKAAMSQFTVPSEEDFEKSVTILDEENMYMEMRPNWMDGGAACTLFTMPDGNTLVAYTINSCGPICHQDRGFYTQENAEWKDVSSEILPDVQEKLTELEGGYENYNPLFQLPRYGTTINIEEQYSGEALFKLLWENGQFVIGN